MEKGNSKGTNTLEIIYGRPKKRHIVKELTDLLKDIELNGTLYQGYLLPASADELITIDSLLVTKEHGLLAFTFADKDEIDTGQFWKNIADMQETIYFSLKSHLGRQKGLRKSRREEAVLPEIITILPSYEAPPEKEILVTTLTDLFSTIESFPPIDEKYWRSLNAAIENVTTIKPVKRRANVKNDSSRGAIIKRIEASISNLDYWQKRAALETPDGPQCIRGLAGSGKTVVLAMKASALHAQNPNWKIAVTFFSRSLRQQFKDLIDRFSFEYQRDTPDPEMLQIMHAWGARNREGIYRKLAMHLDVVPGDYASASSKYGASQAFEGLCNELFEIAKNSIFEPIFDVVMIDEAQDLPISFLRLVDIFTCQPHRIIFAYDELQKLSEEAMPDPELIFIDEEGSPKYSFKNEEGQPRRDEVLPVCYRNTPWALTLAHALGFGIHRAGGMLQHFSNPLRWTRVGYKVEEGMLELGKEVILKRDSDSFPEYFNEELNIEDAIIVRKYKNEFEQAEKVADEILQNLQEDELESDDILIILPEPYTSRSKYSIISDALKRRKIYSHLVGIDTTADQVFVKNSIAVTHIFRAKGNEAPMIYILDSQYYASDRGVVARRNKIFTAITRSRAWVRIYGYGELMDILLKEVNRLRMDDYKLKFKVPTQEELDEMERVHRTITPEERELQKEREESIAKIIEAIKRGDLKKSDVSIENRQLILDFFEQNSE